MKKESKKMKKVETLYWQRLGNSYKMQNLVFLEFLQTKYLTIINIFFRLRYAVIGKTPLRFQVFCSRYSFNDSIINHFFKESLFLTLLNVSRVMPRNDAIYFNGIRLAR